jgi:hypothetical protein
LTRRFAVRTVADYGLDALGGEAWHIARIDLAGDGYLIGKSAQFHCYDPLLLEPAPRAKSEARRGLDQPAFNRFRLKAEKLIDSKVLELIRVQADAGCSSAASALQK